MWGMSDPARHVRHDRLDALRGAAIVWMVGFHFCFDLNHFGLWQPPQRFLSDPFWTGQRTAIVSLFLLCAGLGQAVAWSQGQSAPRFWRRWGQVALCALLVSLGSAWMFPRTWISFGVLHGMVVMLLVLRWAVAPWAANRPVGQRWVLGALVLLGSLALVLPLAWRHPWFDSRWTNWTGLVTRLPLTEDYVPVLPWLGVLLLGVALGRWLMAHRSAWLSKPLSGPMAVLAWLGRWPLSVYMLHQPVLIGGLLLWQTLRA